MSNSKSNQPLSKIEFEQLFKTHFLHLCNFSQQYIQDLNSAKDLVQKVFIQLWENRDQIDMGKNIVSYLFTSVKNRSLNYIRDNKKFRSKVLDLDAGDFEVSIEPNDHDLSILQNKIAVAMAELPEKCRLVFEMSRNQGMKYKEISEELGIAQKTVEAHISKAMKSLRLSLKDYLKLIFLLWFWMS